jgi:osmotically-inducible protein OsmY
MRTAHNAQEVSMAERIPPPDARATTEHTADTRNPEWKNYTPDGHGRTDEQIRADVHGVLERDPGASASGLALTVGDGIVTLSGSFRSEEERSQTIAAIRGIPSVKDLRDQTRIES